MNPDDKKDQTEPAMEGSKNLAQKSRDGRGLQESPRQEPDQPGAEFGGYGRADHAFGRDPGSSSEEGGQGAGGESGASAATVPKTRRGGSDGASQTRHSSNSDSQAQSAGVRRQGMSSTGDARQRDAFAGQGASPASRQPGSDTPDQNHQDQGGQGNP